MDEFEKNIINDGAEDVSANAEETTSEQPETAAEPQPEVVGETSVDSETPNDSETPVNNDEIVLETADFFNRNTEPENAESSYTPQNGTSAPEFNYVNPAPEPVVREYAFAEPRPPKQKNKGLAVFCLILAFLFVAAFSLAAGYFISESESTMNTAGNKKVSTTLKDKPEDDAETDYTAVYNEVSKSVVSILVYNSNGAVGSASGVIYSKDGYIVTNDHIYESAPNAKFVICTTDGVEYKASYVAGDARSDLAVLKINGKVKNLPVAEFGNSKSAVVGEKVITVGYPSSYGETAVLTKGIISATERRVSGTTTNYASTFIQTDATINPGNSGGALANMYGQVIGITSSKLGGDEYDAVTFAIPTTTMEKVVPALIEYGYVKGRAKLGITYTELNSINAEIENMRPGVLISEISEGGPLDGKDVSSGDIITDVNGKKITSANVLLDEIGNSMSGDNLDLTIYDTEKRVSKNITVTLDEDKGSSSYSTKQSTTTDDGSILPIPDDNGNNGNNDNGESISGGNGRSFDFPFD